MKEDEFNWWLVAAGAVVGAALGATAAVLLAPRSGEETRQHLHGALERLRERTDRVAARLREVIDEQRATIESAVQSGREAAAEKADELRRRLRGQEDA
jgi:gas vesicle protein